MSIDVKLPELGDGIDSGDVLSVLVGEGDRIEKEQGIVELETDKATVEVPSSHAGTVVQVHVAAGDTVQVGATLITLQEVSAETTVSGPKAEAEASAAAEPAAAPPREVPTPRESPQPPVPAAAAPAKPAPLPRPQPAAAPAATPHIAAGPAVRRFAREVGVDLTRVEGSGAGGRITREDVLHLVRQVSQAAQTAPSAGSTTSDEWGPVRIERMSKIRRTIATKMHQSWSAVPRVTNFDDADVTELERIRQSSKADYARKGIKLTSLPFVIKSVALALKSHPEVNAALDLEHDQIIYKEYVNVGVAVDTERGLVVPALRGADKMSIPEIARGVASIAENARNNQFTIEDLRGSTFTISNLGAIGGTYSTPIVNVPEVAILLVGRARKMPIVDNDEIVIRLMMPLSLSYDHRLVDGATAARFLNDVIGYLAAPSRLLLAP